MQFCKQCGIPISVLQDTTLDLCITCASEVKQNTLGERKDITGNSNILPNATIEVKDDKILLQSKEGWLLWSGDIASSHKLETLLQKAAKIYRIRKRKK